MNANVEKAKTILRIFFDLPSDLAPGELRREASSALNNASSGEYTRENLKFQLAQMLVNRWGQPLDNDACDKAAGALLELASRG